MCPNFNETIDAADHRDDCTEGASSTYVYHIGVACNGVPYCTGTSALHSALSAVSEAHHDRIRTALPLGLQQEDFLKPTRHKCEVLVKVYAYSVNPIDWKTRRGDLP